MGKSEYLGEELFNLLSRFLNSPGNRHFLNSIRGEYGVLWYLSQCEEAVNAGDLKEQLQVVPGRMTDILNSLEKKGFIKRTRSEKDRRVVFVELTPDGKTEAVRRRKSIHEEYSGLFDKLSPEETRELIRLLKILLTYNG